MAEGEFSLESVRLFMIENDGRVTNHQLVTRFKSFLSDPVRKGEYREKFKDFVNLLASIKEEEGEKYLVLKKRYRELGCANLFPNRSPGQAEDADYGGASSSRSRLDVSSGAPARTAAGAAGVSVQPAAAAELAPSTATRTTERLRVTASGLAEAAAAAEGSESQGLGFYSSIAAAAAVAHPAGAAATSTARAPGRGEPTPPQDITTAAAGTPARVGAPPVHASGSPQPGSVALPSQGSVDRSGSRGGSVLQAMVVGSSARREPSKVSAAAAAADDGSSRMAPQDQQRGPVSSSGGTSAITAAGGATVATIVAAGGAVPPGHPQPVPAAATTGLLPASAVGRTLGMDREQALLRGRAGSEPPASAAGHERSSRSSTASSDDSVAASSSSACAAPEEPKMISVKERTRAINRMTSDTDVSSGAMPKGRKRESRVTSTAHDSEDSETNGGIVNVALEPDEREWMIVSSSADYQQMNKLLRKNPTLAKQKDFTCGYTALHWAAKHGKPDVVKLLISNKAGVNARSHGGFTPLHLAIMHSRYEVAELLLKDFGADASIRDYSGKRPKQHLKRDAPAPLQGLLQDGGRPSFSLGGSTSDDSGFSRSSSFKSKKSTASFSSRVSKVLSTSNENVKDELSPATTPTHSPRVGRKTSSFIFGLGSKESSAAHDNSRDLMPPPAAAQSKQKRSSRLPAAPMPGSAMQPSVTVGNLKDHTDSSSHSMVRSGSAPEIAKLDGGSESHA